MSKQTREALQFYADKSVYQPDYMGDAEVAMQAMPPPIEEDEGSIARAALASLPRYMDKPTVPGWYWYDAISLEKPIIFRVWPGDNGAMTVGEWRAPLHTYTGRWYGPLEPETEAGE